MQDYSPSFYSFGHVVLLLIELNIEPDDKSTDVECCHKISEKVSTIPISILHMKSIADTCVDTIKESPILLVAIPILRY